MRAGAVRDDLHGHIRLVRGHDEPIQLRAHDGGPADDSVQYRLVQDDVETYRRILHEAPLPHETDLDEFVNPLGGKRRDAGLVHGARIARRLQQAGHDRGLVIVNADRFRLQPYVGGEIVQIVALPPAGLLAFAGKCHQLVAFAFVGNVVQVA